MSYQEKKYMEALDEKILNASSKDLKKIQELDLQTQLDGKSFYDNYIEARKVAISKTVSKSE